MTLSRLRYGVGGGLCGVAWPLWADAADSGRRILSSEASFALFGGVLVVLGLILTLAWVARRLGMAPLGGSGPIRLLGGLSVGTRERILLIEVEGTRLLLGVAPGRVQTLHVVSKTPEFSMAPTLTDPLP